MILQSLFQLYERLKDDDDYQLPRPGYSVQNVTFRIVLNPDGSLVDIQDARKTIHKQTRSGKTKARQIPRQMLVPGGSKPTGSGINPCTLWDNSSYLLGYKKPDRNPKKAAKEAERAVQTLEATRSHYQTLSEEITGPEIQAIRRFYTDYWSPEKALEWNEQLDEFAATGFGVFRVLPNERDVHASDTFRTWWSHRFEEEENPDLTPTTGTCLVTGEVSVIARIHDPAIKGVAGAAPGGAKLASFEKHCFRSYGKDQSFNAPVSENAAFAYCNALNALVSGPQSQRHRVRIGEVTTLFWTERETSTESVFAPFLNGDVDLSGGSASGTHLDEDPTLHRRIQAFLQLLRRGSVTSFDELGDRPDTRFFILGLSGNVTRLVVRFWHVGTIREMIERLRNHFEALSLSRRPHANPFHEPEFPASIRLLDQTARERKAISPLLGGQLVQAILKGTPYPMTLYQGVLNRLRAIDPVSYLKAAIIKAILTRNFNYAITMSLDPENTHPAYLLGRLFAALEKTQKDALGDINAGLRERFYSSASTTPASVFPRILRTYQHHLAKLQGGQRVNRERLIQAIHEPITASRGYPNYLALEEQGLFAIGYYHQMQAFYQSKNQTPHQADDSRAVED